MVAPLLPLGFHSPVIKAATAERPEPPDVEHAGRVPVRVARRGMGKRGGWVIGSSICCCPRRK